MGGPYRRRRLTYWSVRRRRPAIACSNGFLKFVSQVFVLPAALLPFVKLATSGDSCHRRERCVRPAYGRTMCAAYLGCRGTDFTGPDCRRVVECTLEGRAFPGGGTSARHRSRVSRSAAHYPESSVCCRRCSVGRASESSGVWLLVRRRSAARARKTSDLGFALESKTSF
jgi:hypothetical protein